MQLQTLQTAYGCLLHDFGKLVYRAGGGSGTHSQQGWRALREALPDPAWKPSLDCLRWHHARELRAGKPPADHPAYIAYLADNLSAALDRREIEGESGRFVRDLPLSPVFSHMNGEHGGFALSSRPEDGTLRLPHEQKDGVPPQHYANAQRELTDFIRTIGPQAEWLNSLLTMLECWTGSLPSSTYSGESPDISLYDHLKTTAAIGSCISEYLLEQGEKDLEGRLFDGEKQFRTEPCFLLYSADLSGIQRFIYSISTTKALRSLRGRSFFLGLFMEHYVDELLEGCGLSRANLLYSGGGHCYLLLPNIPSVRETAEKLNLRFNDFLLDQFGASLFLAHGWTVCCGNDLINVPAAEAPYKAMFRRVTTAVSRHKLRRYSPAQLLRLNGQEGGADRECRVCGRSDRLDGDLCPWCKTFEDLSDKIQNTGVCVIGSDASLVPDFTLPALDSLAGFTFTDEAQARACLKAGKAVRRIYTKNKSCTGLRYSTRLYVGDYAFSNRMDALAEESQGVQRLGVCRMDVDDLGRAFVQGFEVPGATDPARRYHYVTLSRTAAFSRQMTLFFQLYINNILSGKYGGKPPLAVTIVYSGGDDVFLVGAWDHVLEAANRIQLAFDDFTCHSLTISGGFGLFDDHFPIRLAAAKTAELEARAKGEAEKNAIALFDPDAQHTYCWDIFRDKVEGEKGKMLQSYFRNVPDRGNSLLYKLLLLLRQAQEEEKINLARYAYQLARLEPSKNSEHWQTYRAFADAMYGWGLNDVDQGELITAIYLHVYRNREKNEVKDNA